MEEGNDLTCQGGSKAASCSKDLTRMLGVDDQGQGTIEKRSWGSNLALRKRSYPLGRQQGRPATPVVAGTEQRVCCLVLALEKAPQIIQNHVVKHDNARHTHRKVNLPGVKWRVANLVEHAIVALELGQELLGRYPRKGSGLPHPGNHLYVVVGCQCWRKLGRVVSNPAGFRGIWGHEREAGTS